MAGVAGTLLFFACEEEEPNDIEEAPIELEQEIHAHVVAAQAPLEERLRRAEEKNAKTPELDARIRRVEKESADTSQETLGLEERVEALEHTVKTQKHIVETLRATNSRLLEAIEALRRN